MSLFIGQNSVYPQTVTPNPVSTTPHQPVIYMFTLDQGIMPAAWRLVRKAVDQAEAMNADYIIMRLNTYGGRVDMADSISRKLLNAKPTVVVWIDHNAASAGAMISLSCDSIYMSAASSFGAATVVEGGTGVKMPDKYQSYMRSTMRSLADKQHRDPCIAEAMVDERIACAGINDSVTTLTFTTNEAIKFGYCEGEANSMDEVIHKLGVINPTIIEHKMSAIDKLIAFLLTPVVSSLLMLMIFGGIWFELQHPGIGLPLFAAITGAVLFFAPNYLEGLAQNWEILLFIVGLVLIGVEILIIGHFNIIGVLGITCTMFGLVLSMLGNKFFNFSGVRGSDIGAAAFQVVLVMMFLGVFMLFFAGRIFDTGFGKKFVLQTTQKAGTGYRIETPSPKSFIGAEGTAVTNLRPAGKVEINGERYDAQADASFIAIGLKVKVLRLSGSVLVVDVVS